MPENGLLDKLCAWYAEQCNGEWEHGSGIKITTVDNPGWGVTINLRETAQENIQFERVSEDRGESDWLQCFIRDGQFIGAGDPSKLGAILERFLKFAGKL